MALRNGDFDWLGLCLVNQVEHNPFLLAVPPAGAAYNQSPAVTVSIPVAWIPYVIGALTVLGQSVSYGGAGTERAVFVPFDFNVVVAAGQVPYRMTLQGIANQSGSNRFGYPSGYGTLEIFTLVKVIRLADA